MLKLNASYSKKVPVQGQEYSSQSYHASVEVEIPDGLNPAQLQGRIHETFQLVRSSVESELGNGGHAQTGYGNPPKQLPAGRNRDDLRLTNKQLKFLSDIAIRDGKDLNELNAVAFREFNVNDVSCLTRKQASDLIDMLNGNSGGQQRRRAA